MTWPRITVAALAVLLVSGCEQGSATPTTAPATPAATASVDPVQLTRVCNAVATVFSDPDPDPAELGSIGAQAAALGVAGLQDAGRRLVEQAKRAGSAKGQPDEAGVRAMKSALTDVANQCAKSGVQARP